MKPKSYLLPADYCKKNGYHTTKGKISFSRSSMVYFALYYCSTDWETVDKEMLKDKMILLYNMFNSFTSNGLPIFKTSEKPKLVDLYN